MTRFWIGVACREHVDRGVMGGFAQFCHGKRGPLQKMKEGDGIIYYSPTEKFGDKVPYRRLTAIGKVNPGEPYLFAMSEDLIPWRRNVTYFDSQEILIEPLLEDLSFIPNKRRWGFPFRRGCFEIPEIDFRLIAAAMGVPFDD